MRRVFIDAPAKINLGLEVIRRRTDGYHDIQSVMAMIELADRLEVFEDEAESNGLVDGVAGPENLVRRALDRYRATMPGSSPLGWRIEKRIPAAAGLGGASSDAAAALLAANELAGSVMSRDDLMDLAADLGSDIPFFLGSPVALATGRGTDLEPVRSVAGDVLLIVPSTNLEAKTESMYASLIPEDFGDGTGAGDIVTALANGFLPGVELLGNSFSRAAATKVPSLNEIWHVLTQMDVGSFALSGAGPATFVLVPPGQSPSEMATSLQGLLPAGTRLIPTAFRQKPIGVEQWEPDSHVRS